MKRSIVEGLCTPSRIRQVVQGVFFALFLYLFGRTAFPLRSVLPVDLFLRMDPLLGLTVLFAGKVVIASLLLAVPLMLATVLWGRFFCAYMCPMGTTIDVLDFLLLRKVPRRGLKHPFRLRNLPYYLLFSLLGASLLGIVFLHFLDPICILIRTSALVFFPFVQLAGNLGLDLLRLLGQQLDLPGLVHSPYDQAAFSMNILTLLLFGVIIGLSAVELRFWCRNVCPLGGLFSLLARLSPFRGTLSEACTECGRCAQVCPLDAVDGRPGEAIRSTCSLCLNCLSICPERAITFGMGRFRGYTVYRPIDLSRRGVLVTLGVTLAGTALIPTHVGSRLKGRVIRPPGSIPEKAFLDRCVRCGECMKACPTHTIQPALLQSGWEGLWTPYLILRWAPCDPECNVCGYVCPTRAIRPLPLEEKRAAHIGTAIVDRVLCWPWRGWRACQICYDECHAAGYHAIELQTAGGFKVPVVLEAHCVGCGLCEFRCPVNEDKAARIKGRAAIVVHPDGEQRLSEGSYIALNRSKVIDKKGENGKEYLPPFLR